MIQKAIKIVLIVLAGILSNSLNLQSQSGDIEAFFKKYSDYEGITYINFSPGPGAMEAAADAKKADKETTEMVKNIKTVKILTATKSKSKVNLFEEAKKSINLSAWEDYLTMKEDGTNVKMLYKPAQNGKVKEFLMLIAEEKETTIIWISGTINLDDIPKIQGMMGKGNIKSPKHDTKKGN